MQRTAWFIRLQNDDKNTRNLNEKTWMKKLLKKIRQISTYSFSRQFTRGKQARSLGPGLLASTQDGILAGDSLASQSSYPSYRRCNRGIPGVMPPSILRIAQKNSAQQSHSRLVNFHFICNPANCHKQMLFSEDAKPWRNYFPGFMWVLYISSPKGLVPTTSRRSPPQRYFACRHNHEHRVASTSG